ncbi:Kinetochore protein NDC80-like protein [Frankliniella fusca]|uniref:Kinetochore protein NDC80 n=1 Tax=Frankliniella fusca TaxID=407009 RepID=A0AAE1H181_9NEOP|nr:Kinetochore protein NDC80-like protein [Frankliniella fusca]
MRKSTQGNGRASQPLRIDFEDQRASSSRRPIDVRRASGIPQPGKMRRSSSETRDGRMSAVQPALKRYNSQHNLLATPANASTTPLRGLHYGSTRSQGFSISPFSDGGRSSRKSTYSGVGGVKSNRIVKDTRPLMDKNFLQQEMQKITSFLIKQPHSLSLGAKGINLRQLTTKLFVEIFNFLVGFLDEYVSVNMANYVNEIPLIMKKWGYSGNLNTSWLKTVNTPHALPHVVGLLSWLVSCASVAEETDFEEYTANCIQSNDDVLDDADADGFLYGNAKVYLPHLMTQYKLWNEREEVAEKNEERRFIMELCNRNGVSDEAMKECEIAIRNLEIELEDPKEQEEIAAIMEEDKRNNEFLKDYNKALKYKNQMEEFINTYETKLEEEKLKLSKEEEAVRDLQCRIMELKELLSNQVMTVEERDKLQNLCTELNSSIRENEEYIALVSNQTFSDDLQMANRAATLKKRTQAYNKIIVMESCWLPELQSLMDETNYNHPGAQEELAEIESQAHKLKDDIQNKFEKLDLEIKELQSKVLQIEERKALTLQEEHLLFEKVKEYETSIEAHKTQSREEIAQLKKMENSLKSSNEARISCDSLQEAKDQLEKLIEKREFGKAHIMKLREKADSFFKQSVAITQGLFDRVSKAESEFERKRQALFQSTEDAIEKTMKETATL